MGKIVLKDNTEFGIAQGAIENKIAVVITNIEEFAGVYDAFTEENLETFSILNDSGVISRTFKDKYVIGGANVVPVDGGYNVVFELGNVDLVQKRLKAIEVENAKTKVSLDAALEVIDYLLLGDTTPETEV